jgi:hypothetical protein
VVFVPVFDTLPEYWYPSLSASCTPIISPGLNPIAFNPVVKLTVSFSSCADNSFHLPYLCACEREVHPKATEDSLTSLFVFNIF